MTAAPPLAQGVGVRPAVRPALLEVDFDERPFTVAWELTRSCALACLHCRAEAQPRRHPDELTTDEAFRVIDEIAALAPPVLVLTGGDPMMRPDLLDITRYAVGRGLTVSVSPTTTSLTTRWRLVALRDAGVHMIHVSLDGATAETHDAFRGFPGTFARVMRILADLQALEIPVQVGTTVARQNVDELPALADLLASRNVRMWSLFFLVPTGRGRVEDMIEPERARSVWEWMAGLSGHTPFAIRTTAAPQFRVVMTRRAQRDGGPSARVAGAGYEVRATPSGMEARGVNDGKGFLFIDHLGNICPSGFLQLSAGNVRTHGLAEVYRQSPLFTALRDPALLEGRCGACSFADLCGGSRARAYAMRGSYLAEDPLCCLPIGAN